MDTQFNLDDARHALHSRPDDPMSWHGLGLALAVAGDVAGFLALADAAAGPFGDAVIFARNVFQDLSGRRLWGPVRDLAAALPADRRERAVALYYCGCAEVVAGHHAAALELFHQFQQAVLARAGEFPLAHPDFNLIFRQGVLVEHLPLVRGLAARPMPPEAAVRFMPPEAAVRFMGPAPTDAPPPPFVLAYVVDARYFRRFAGELCAGHAAAGLAVPLHFHVAAADAATAPDIEALRRAHPTLTLGFSLETAAPWDGPVYYTCARFMIAPRLHRHYRCTVVTSDADILPVVAPERIAAAAAGADFACFRTGRDEPASVFQASIMVFPATATTTAFLADLARLCALKLHLPQPLGWMLDQAALYSVLSQRLTDDPSFRFVALDQALGMDFADAVRQLSTSGEKLAIMAG